MCGLTGFADFNKSTSIDELKSMTDAIAYRGPDDHGYLYKDVANAQIGFGHRRLSILDLSPLGHQPYEFEHLQLAYNGEIYNFKEIREKLIAKGYSFRSNSDTEVIIKAFAHYGIACIEEFIGMFAFALLDTRENKLYLVRDRAGVKPMHWYWHQNLLLFGSELKSFTSHPRFSKELDQDSVALYFQYSYIPAPYTIYKHTHKLKPGHFLEIDLTSKAIRIEKYWDVVELYNKPKLNISYSEAEQQLEHLLKSACEYRMVSDVPVGVFLSGGYDSTAVAALLQSGRTEKLKTFTIGFDEPRYNEAPHAKKVAQHLGTDHTEYYCTHKEAFDIIPALPKIYDEPLGDNSIIPTTLVSQVAIKQVKVALSADGGDEIFGGYPKFQMSLDYSTKFPGWLSQIIGNSMSLLNPDRVPFTRNAFNFSTRYRKVQSILQAHNPTVAMKIISQFNTDSELKKRLAFNYANRATDFDLNGELNAGNDSLNRMLAIDYRTFLVDNNLTKVDRATMSVSLEGREPLLDHRIIDFVAQLPSHYKHQPGKTKIILKNLVHKYVPTEIMDRPKMGFIVPIMGWFRNELKDLILTYLSEDNLKQGKLFNVQETIALRDRYLRGDMENIQKIWHILVFQMWRSYWKV
jgi:asparagine synthase (glutamine-hydrolysing)